MIKVVKYIALLIILSGFTMAYGESIRDIDERAQWYYERKEFSKATTEWLRALELDPKNIEIQQKIEAVYEEKHSRDVSFLRAKIYYNISRKNLRNNKIDESKLYGDRAIKNFVKAYRIDPNDLELKQLKILLKKLQDEINIALDKRRLSKEKKEKYEKLIVLASQNMEQEIFEKALDNWEEALDIFPQDNIAREGKRKSELAIENRLKFERIKALMLAGINLFNQKKYSGARQEFEQVTQIDPGNDEAEDYLEKIEELLLEQQSFERRRIQAEQFYRSGISNLRTNNFDGARDDFESTIALIKNYKDSVSRLNSIDRLEKVYEEKLKRIRLQDIDKEFQNGLLYLAEGNYKSALIAFERTLRLDPNNKLARRYIDTVKEALKQQREEKIDENSVYYDIVNSLIVSGKNLYKKGLYEESRKKWERILKLFPKNKIATEFLLKCQLKINPQSFKLFSDRIISEGEELLREKKYENALAKFKLIKSIKPDYPGIDRLISRATRSKKTSEAPKVSVAEINRRYNRGLALYRRGGADNIKKALDEFQWINKRDPSNVKTLIILNKIQAQLRIGQTSIKSSGRQLSARQRALVRKFYFRGINYYSNNRFEKAIEQWRKVLAIDPDNTKAKNNIRKCLVLIKR